MTTRVRSVSIPVAVRLGTTSAETAYARLRQAGSRLHNNGLVYLEEEPGVASDN